MANEMEEQPFCIIGSKGKFGSHLEGKAYMQPLAPPPWASDNREEERPKEEPQRIYPKSYGELLNRVAQTEYRTLYLDKKFNQHLSNHKGVEKKIEGTYH